MPGLSTHVLDTAIGKPAAKLKIKLEVLQKKVWKEIGVFETDQDGRVKSLLGKEATLGASVYKLTFQTKDYFDRHKKKCFYPSVEIIFEPINPKEHHHVPLLISGFGYSTYRGS